MPLPRKNVTKRVRDDDERLDIYVRARKPQMFDWDDMGLGLDMPLSSSNSDVYSDKSSDRYDLVITPKNSKISKSPKVPKSSKSSARKEAQSSTHDWIRNLIECRKEKYQKSAPDDHGFRTMGKGWLLDQHKALHDGTIPVTYKCIIAASGISSLFNNCREEFMRPEYRSRYWAWSINFILLIDHFIDFGHINVNERSRGRYQPLIAFLNQCKAQKSNGSLPQQRDQLLTALGLVWDTVEEEEADEVESSDDNSGDNQNDKTWQMPSKLRSWPVRKRDTKKRSTRKRKRGTCTREKTASAVRQTRETSPPPLYTTYHPTPPSREALRAWAKKILTLRTFYRKRMVDDDLYDIPSSRVSLRVWMNAEVARCSAGVLREVCRGILLAAEMADRSEVDQLNADCEKWGKGFVAYIDCVLRKGKLLQIVIDFLCDCRKRALSDSLALDCDALLSGVDDDWMESKLMKTCVFQKEKARSDRMARLHQRAPRISGQDLEEDDVQMNGHVVEINLDTDSSVEEVDAPKKRGRTEHLVSQMLTEMIDGEVGKTVEGRNPTAAERRAKEWVLNAGAKTFDAYAKNWFRSATAE